MKRRTKVLIICGNADKERDEYLEWACVLDEHLGKKSREYMSARRIETPYAIVDFAVHPIHTGRYQVVLGAGEDDEKVLALAIGE